MSLFLDVFYQEPQPEREESEKRGFCGVISGPTWTKHQNCRCSTDAQQFHELEMPNFCKILCNSHAECKGYSSVINTLNICYYYTTSDQCDSGNLSSGKQFSCDISDAGSTGDLVNIHSEFISETGCYIKSPLNYFNY